MCNRRKSGYAIARWLLSELFLLLTLLRDRSPFAFERKMSITSFDLRRKTKHHRHRNGTRWLATAKPVTTNDEEMQFSLRSRSYAYVIELDLGTPPQRMEFLVDTGSLIWQWRIETGNGKGAWSGNILL
ncbi:uncharacterized protein LOC122959970 [Acropora millepora]|uniref:uncharacterized protein LOC122959970 n=1 Tax=Acropora millepora TaxID=45264 RepID=UPI001CF265FC|nr:uncharacterized protein LOC122959970 [Acropora millepora]XP_044177600.1 uncharacterized protein LOC122959970 [Acropora millepora]XP_044177601.1 uncharacterized protein LOC122959970 [Acropora millepora]XP_044177602.1 uncharacterized protein LOC122959970 [Acropora millepora]